MSDFLIAHMYPELMNLYGDRGNLICLQKRLQWLNQGCEIININLGDNIDFEHIDMLFMGGGSDREQGLVYADLIKRADKLMEEIDKGLPVLCICGAYQLLGTSYKSYEGKEMEGLGLFDFYTLGQEKRLIGNILIESDIGGKKHTVVGFENHSGRTFLNNNKIEAFGKVIKGYGNNGEDQMEGIKYKNLIGSYMHGPLLPKNPELADFFIYAMAKRKGTEISSILDNKIEKFAHKQVKQKIMQA